MRLLALLVAFVAIQSCSSGVGNTQVRPDPQNDSGYFMNVSDGQLWSSEPIRFRYQLSRKVLTELKPENRLAALVSAARIETANGESVENLVVTDESAGSLDSYSGFDRADFEGKALLQAGEYRMTFDGSKLGTVAQKMFRDFGNQRLGFRFVIGSAFCVYSVTACSVDNDNFRLALRFTEAITEMSAVEFAASTVVRVSGESTDCTSSAETAVGADVELKCARSVKSGSTVSVDVSNLKSRTNKQMQGCFRGQAGLANLTLDDTLCGTWAPP
jgi:hypothetical protein